MISFFNSPKVQTDAFYVTFWTTLHCADSPAINHCVMLCHVMNIENILFYSRVSTILRTYSGVVEVCMYIVETNTTNTLWRHPSRRHIQLQRSTPSTLNLVNSATTLHPVIYQVHLPQENNPLRTAYTVQNYSHTRRQARQQSVEQNVMMMLDDWPGLSWEERVER